MTLLPGAIYDPGIHWNYEGGSLTPQAVFWHYTVGRDSRAILRDQGLCALLVWDNCIWEFAPVDSVNWTQCEWNRWGQGIEVESLDGSITPGQIANLGYATLYMLTTYGIPYYFYDGPRMEVGTPFRGVTNHRNLVHHACDQHYDGFDQWVWDQALAPKPPPPPPEDGMVSVLIVEERDGPDKGKIWLVNPDTNEKSWIKNWEWFVSQMKLRDIVIYVGGRADNTLHHTNEWVSDRLLWMDLLDNARDVDTYVG